eukprot:SAG22_NODE_1261_length_4977_cov_9.689832_4_plen_114_part_00
MNTQSSLTCLLTAQSSLTCLLTTQSSLTCLLTAQSSLTCLLTTQSSLTCLLTGSCMARTLSRPFNSWDRQPFAWEKKDDGSLNLAPSTLTIHRNFFFANYGAGQAVDNDGSSH